MNTVPVILYSGGEVVVGHGTIKYSTKGVKMMRISRSTTLSELIERVHRKLNIDATKFSLNLSTKYSYMDRSRSVEAHVSIDDDDTLQFMLDSGAKMQCLELYIEFVPITQDEAGDDLGSYIPCITQGFSTIGFNTQVGTSTTMFNHNIDQNYAHREYNTWDHYVTEAVEKDTTGWPSMTHGWDSGARGWDSTYGSGALDNMNVGCSSHDVFAVAPEQQTCHDLVGDSYRNMTDNDSEAETLSSKSDDGLDDDVDEDAHINTVDNMGVYPGEGTSSPTPQHSMTQSNGIPFVPATNEMPPFFSTLYEEQILDSVGVPSRSRSNFYSADRGELCSNMVFKDKKELIAAVKDFFVRVVRREYRVVESTKTLWTVRCKNISSNINCGWGLRASLKPKLGYFKITIYGGPHTCISSQVGIDHHNLDKNMVASTLIGIVRCDPSCEIKYVRQIIKDKFGYEISYAKAWHSLKRAVENVYGTWESSVRMLPRYMGALAKYNQGTILEWNHFPTNNPMVKILNYVFWAFRPCVDEFRHCRKIISVDGTHLYTKYKHKMLIAVGLDANNNILPLAFTIVDEENYDSWKWFLVLLCRHVVRGSTGVCLISDRHRAILSAVEDIPDFKAPRGVHRFCLRHVCSNFNSQFKNVHLKDLCWQAGTQHQIRKFDDTMNEIKNKNLRAYTYLSEIDKHKWTFAHDGGWRRGVMTTNLSECVNGVFKGTCRLPISAIVQLTFQRCVEYLIERVSKSQRMIHDKQPWPDYAFRTYEKWSTRSSDHSIRRLDIREQSASVTTRAHTGQGQHVQVVSLSTHDCSCGKWTIFGIPCSHAIATAKYYGLDPTTFVQPWFGISEYVNTYEGRFRPVADEHYWDAPTFELHHNPTRRERRRAGRNRSTRIRNEMDQPMIRERQRLQRENASR